MSAIANQKGGPPTPYPLRNPQPPTRDMTGVGKGPWPTDKKVGGVQEKDAREKVYRSIGTS